MRHLRPVLAVLAVVAILVACSSAPGDSSGNQQSQGAEASDGGGGGGGGASDGGGGGGGGGGNGGIFGDGSAEYRVTGGITDEGELRFVPAASTVNQDGIYNLSFYSEDSEKLLIIVLSDDGNSLSWTNSEATMAGTTCDWNVTRKDDSGAEGTFTCNNQPYFSSTGGSGTANISGSFDARI